MAVMKPRHRNREENKIIVILPLTSKFQKNFPEIKQKLNFSKGALIKKPYWTRLLNNKWYSKELRVPFLSKINYWYCISNSSFFLFRADLIKITFIYISIELLQHYLQLLHL